MKTIFLVSLLMILTVGTVSANLLSNPGFEVEGDPGCATNWWYYDAAGRATWAARTDTAGNSFYPAGNPWGGFGQDVEVSTTNGQIFTFSIYGKAEWNYTNENTTIGMEFWNDSAKVYEVRTNVYDRLRAQATDWALLTMTHTNTVAGIVKVIVRCDYGDGVIASGQSQATCQWDDSSLIQTPVEECSPGPLQQGKFEPEEGVYLGVLLEQGGTAEELQEFNEKAGKTHSVYAKFVIFGTDPFPWEWVNTIKTHYPGAACHIVLEPMVGFTNFYAGDWGVGQPTYEMAREFATNCAHAQVPIFLRFGHEANGDWYPWHPEYSTRYGFTDTVTEATYILGWQNFADLVHSLATNVAMVWAPNQGNGPDPLPNYEAVYPGDDYVDWVGLSIYNGDWYGNSNAVYDYQFKNGLEKGYWQLNGNPDDDTLQNFYWTFSDPNNPCGHRKPMMIAETSAQFVPEFQVTNVLTIASFESLHGPDFTATRTLAQFQNLNNEVYISSGHTWVEGFEDLSLWNWGPWGENGHTWSNSFDAVEGQKALVMSGTPESGKTYIGGNARSIQSVPFTSVLVIAEFQSLDSDGLTATPVQTLDSFDRPADWNWGPWEGLDTWSNAPTYSEGTNAVRVGGTPISGGATYVGGNGRNQPGYGLTNWTTGNGIQFWVRRLDFDHPDPVLALTCRSRTNGETYTATAETPVVGLDYYPVKFYFSDMNPAPGFTWADIRAVTLTLSSGTAGERPSDACIDNWSLVTLSEDAYTDQDWGSPGPLHDPWNDGEPGGAGTNYWSLVSYPLTGYPSMAACIGGTDPNTNSYICGNGCFLRSEFRNWSGGTHIALFAARADDENPDPLLLIEAIDALSRTARVMQAVSVATCSWLLNDFDNMEVDAGFDWTDVRQVKLHLLTSEPNVTPAALYLKRMDIVSVAQETPRDWSGYDGMELWVKRSDDSRPFPLVNISLRSGDTTSNLTASASRVVTGTDYYALKIPFSEMSASPGFQWTNITVLLLEMLSEQVDEVPSDLYVDRWNLVQLEEESYDDPDWWPAGTNAFFWGDATDGQGGWFSAALEDDSLSGYPVKSLRLSGVDANSNYYIGGNGFSLRPGETDWSEATYLAMMVRRSTADTNYAEPLLSLSLTDGYAHTARVSQVVVSTNYIRLLNAFDNMQVDAGFVWSNVQSVVLEFLSGSPGRTPSDVFMKDLQIGTVSNRYEQDWWCEGDPLEPWGDIVWTQTTDAAEGTYALQIAGVVTNPTQWYVGGNGCSLAPAEQNWTNSSAIVLHAKRGNEPGRPDPKIKITLDNDYAETNGNEATVVTRLANDTYTEIIITYEDFLVDPGFSWAEVRMVKIEMFTNVGGETPNDIYIDHLRRAWVTLINGEDNLRWKHDWIDQLFALEDFEDADPDDPDAHPDYVDISRVFPNLHMINWFHVRKFEDGMTKDLQIAEDGTNGVAYGSYYERILPTYFLTNIVATLPERYTVHLAYTNGTDLFPQATAEQSNYTAAACCWMIARYLNGTSFNQSQDQIYWSNAHDPEHNDEITPYSCANWMFKTVLPGYHFTSRWQTNLTMALQEAVYWMDYIPPGGLKTPVYLVCGTNWSYKVARGFQTDHKPYDGQGFGPWNTNTFTVYGLWLNDPRESGLGYNVYASAAEMASVFPPSKADGTYWFVAEPPEDAGELREAEEDIRSTVMRLGAADPNPTLAAYLANRETSSRFLRSGSGGGDPGLAGSIPPALLQDQGFMNAFTAGQSVRFSEVNGLRSGLYWLAAGSEQGPRSSRFVLKLAPDGSLLQATWSDAPEYFEVMSMEAATWAAQQQFSTGLVVTGGQLMESGNSPFHPAWDLQADLNGTGFWLRVSADVDLSGDADGDGVSDGDELYAGENPNDPISIFSLEGGHIRQAGSGEVVLQWASHAGRTYSIRQAASLAGPYTSVAGGLAATEPANTYTAIVSSVTAFFRVEVE